MRIEWRNTAAGTETGNSLGYATMSSQLRRHAARYAQILDNPGGDVALFLCHPAHYHPPTDGTPRVLLTMFEHDGPGYDMRVYTEAFERCDLIITPSEFCRKMFRAYTTKPIEVVPLGVETDVFTYRKRRFIPGREPFRFLFVGAPNVRKWTILEQLFGQLIAPLGPAAHLYIKTTGADLDWGTARLAEAGRAVERDGQVVRGEGYTVDSRLLSRDELVKLYHDAHVFLFPTAGEGWGLPLCEAAATGLPIVASRNTAVTEILTDETAFLIDCEDRAIMTQGRGDLSPTRETHLSVPRLDHAAALVTQIAGNYHAAQVRGRRASRSMAAYSWDASARKLVDAIRRFVR